jgi:hypothetical protein
MAKLGLWRKHPSDNPETPRDAGEASTDQSTTEVEQSPSPKTLGRRKASLLTSCAGTTLAHALHRRRSPKGKAGL